ncbi:MAG: type II secretion system GspH family protein [Oligoflexia bacterium]|nr:type II secretion system GspH family protein [Oligoflexia bacterium]
MQPDLRSPEAGFTLIEVMVALVLFLGISATLGTGYVAMLKRSNVTETRTLAMGAAQQVLDVLRLTDPSTLPTSGSSTQNVAIGGKTFAVTTTYCATSSYCASASNRHIKVSVYRSNQKVFDVETVFTRLR